MDQIVARNVRPAEPGVLAEPGRVGLLDALVTWGKVSIAGIGGSGLQLASMYRLLVEERKWISDSRFFNAFGYCIALPGPETQQLAVYIGWLTNRLSGGAIAGGLFILPGIICMMALSFGYVTGADSQVGQAIFLGVRPAILAIMVEALLRFGRHVLHNKWMTAVAFFSFAAALVKIPFPLIVGAAALLGAAGGMARRPAFTRGDAAGNPSDNQEPPLPEHTRPTIRRVMGSAVLWLGVWLAPLIGLFLVLGPDNIYTQISFVFSKVALLAIGGDYAVVAYGAQPVVESFHWLSSREVQEGVAMGEMVPGTIMIVTQFFGFVAAYRDPGQLPPLAAGVVGGLLATWMTLVPCFLYVLLAAPFIEGLRRNPVLSSTLTAVTAGAVGMILYLSVWFGVRTVFHEVETVSLGSFGIDLPIWQSVDVWAILIFLGAAIAALRFRVGTLTILLASAAAGFVLVMLGFAS